MSDKTPMSGHPYDGRDQSTEGQGLPGERPLSDDEQAVQPPTGQPESEHASRAAEDGPMESDGPDIGEPTPGMPQTMDPPSPADATEGDPPGGSVANQPGRDPHT